MSKESRLDSVGWLFFGIVCLLAVGPALYVVFQITMDSTPLSLRVGSAIFLAGFGAAIISWIANSILGYIADRGGAEIPEPAPKHKKAGKKKK